MLYSHCQVLSCMQSHNDSVVALISVQHSSLLRIVKETKLQPAKISDSNGPFLSAKHF